MKNRCKIFYGEEYELESNTVTVVSPINKRFRNGFGCGTPYWRS